MEFVEFDAAFGGEVVEDGEGGPGAVVDFGAEAWREDAGEIAAEAAAGDVAEGVDGVGLALVAGAVVELLGEGTGEGAVVEVGLEEGVGEGLFGAGEFVGDLVLQCFKDDLAGEGVAVGVEAVGGEAEDEVAGFDGGAAEDALFFNDADDAADEVVLAGLVEAGHLGGFSADEGAVGCLAGFFHAGDEFVEDFGVEFAEADVVEEEEGLCAHDGDVVDAMVDDVLADALVVAGLEGEFEFGADAVNGGDEDGVFDFELGEVEEAAESADGGEDFGAAGGGEGLFEA